MDDELPSLLIVVIDTSTPFWRTREYQRLQRLANPNPDIKYPELANFQETLEALLVFLEAYLLTHRGNDVAVFAASHSGSRALYPPPDLRRRGGGLPSGDVTSGDLRECLVAGMKKYAAYDNAMERAWNAVSAAAAAGGGGGGGRSVSNDNNVHWLPGPAIAKALSQGLCYVNQMAPASATATSAAAGAIQPRGLILQGSADVPEHYNAFMNAVFSAQKAKMPLDCCALGPKSMFLEQAAYLSGGMVLVHSEPYILPSLLATFLPSPSCRKYLLSKKQEGVDLRAACFCHRRIVEIAYVCTVCLSVFCSFAPECTTCGAVAKPVRTGARDLPGANSA